MTTLVPRAPYSQDELRQLYPDSLSLQFVQVLMRHGERSPVSARFQNAGLAAFWPYCSVSRKMLSSTHDLKDGSWSSLQWKRRLETFGEDDGPVLAAGPRGEVDSVCNLGELTDEGRQSTWQLGTRLRHLYVDQLKFMPSMVDNAEMIYLRATPIPRALESLQEAFWGMYPSDTRAPSFPPVTIVTRAPADETLFPNDGNCRRFAALSRAFAQRTSDRWNQTSDMDYLNKLIQKWMPGESRVAVDGRPRLSGIMDTINSTLAHGPETRLPGAFYDEKGRKIIEKIGVEEWFSGYQESEEYRSLGIGGLMGDLVQRMVGNAQGKKNNGMEEDGNTAVKLAMSGCHDTTLAAVLASLGAFQGEPWPPYTSHIALELFKISDVNKSQLGNVKIEYPAPSKSWFSGLFGKSTAEEGSPSIARQKIDSLSEAEKSKLDGYYVRLRYNDRVMEIPGCKPAGKHFEGETSFCTLGAFKTIVDKFTPTHWKSACRSNLDAPAFPEKPQPAGF
ncbi:histidine acid phosphatase-like protein [Calycina marina]|uniref:3-phytase n=1 Tax=Calycina marina TaxID=1763456 RepID=A0A9P8CEH7_9HELO|nr:histidine acid phosphatase-like protein [Calycina marina]